MRVVKGKWPPGLAAVLAASLLAGCVNVGVRDYEGFRGAVEAEATCRQLIEIRDDFTGSAGDLDRIEGDLRELGCTTKDSERNDL